MSVTLRTIYPNQLYQLQIEDAEADVEVIRYTYATGLITSTHLPNTTVEILQARWDLLTSGFSPSQKNACASLLANLIHVSDPAALALVFYGSSAGVANIVYVTGLSTNTINVGIPNSVEMWLNGGLAVAGPV